MGTHAAAAMQEGGWICAAQSAHTPEAEADERDGPAVRSLEVRRHNLVHVRLVGVIRAVHVEWPRVEHGADDHGAGLIREAEALGLKEAVANLGGPAARVEG